MDHAADKVYEQLEEAIVDDVVVDARGFSSGSQNTSVLMDYVHHVAVTICNG